MLVLRACLVCLGVALCGAAAAPAAELQLLNATRLTGQLVGIDGKGVTFKANGGAEKTYANTEIVSLDLGTAPRELAGLKYIGVELVDGSTLNCSDFKLKGGAAILTVLGGEEKSPRLLELPTNQVNTVIREAQDTLNVLNFKNLIGNLRGQRRDIYVFARGEGVNRKLTPLVGTFGEATLDAEMGDKVKFTTDTGKEQNLFQRSIHGLMFAPVPNENAPQPVCRVTDTHKNMLMVQSVALRDRKVTLKTVAGVEVDYPLEAIVRFDYSTGALKYLSELKSTVVRNDSSETPFSPVILDKNLDDRPLTLAGVKYERGLSIHAGTALTWAANGDYRRLKGLLGVDDEFDIASSVLVIVEADGREVLKQAVKKKDKPFEVNLDITGVKQVRLLVQSDDPTGFDLGHQVNFVDAKFTK